jgi:hypothetical protein
MIDLKLLQKDFDKNFIKELLVLGIDSLKTNIILTEEGILNNNVEKIFRGAHNIKGLGFMRFKIDIIKYATIITDLSRNKKINEINFYEVISNLIILRKKIDEFKNWYSENSKNI